MKEKIVVGGGIPERPQPNFAIASPILFSKKYRDLDFYAPHMVYLKRKSHG